MRSNRSSGNGSTELRLIQLMQASGIKGWRRGVLLKGRPDFVFHMAALVIFVDGCFWHGCSCKRRPTQNRRFWWAKFERNRAHDRRVTRSLRCEGWQVVRIWEHQLKRSPDAVIRRINVALKDAPRGS
jgi:DNA mismatch endonuclease (patch repair protein)